MQLTALDWLTIAIALTAIFAPAFFYARRASRSVTEFFASGRAAPWWLVGTSMVATTFATDTPGLVTQLVREKGVAGNWLWWAFLLTGMATVFFYARLWRRSGVLTDLEFYEIRYAGRAAAFVRGFRAVYLGLLFNCFIMATVTLAAAKIAATLFGVPRWQTIAFSIIFCSTIATVSGLWGVLVSDLVQFALAMTGSIIAAVFALRHPHVGGLAGLIEKTPDATVALLPDFGDWSLALAVFIVPLTIQWWSVWYPGAEPGGGSYIAQRILASKNERHALGATLWFNVAHYGLRPWPWILVGLCSLHVYPELDSLRQAFPDVQDELINHDLAYPAMLTVLPAGFLGLVAASLCAAYVSTMSTHLNWGASYLVNDVYRRFVRPDATDRHYVGISRVCTVLLMLVAGGLVYAIDSSREGFVILMSIGAGTGLIYLLRWYWWRINAWSEVAAMAGSFLVNVALLVGRRTDVLPEWPDHATLIVTVATTTIIWLTVTLATAPSAESTLVSFFRLVRPAGPGWRRIRERHNLSASSDSLTYSLAGWVLGCLAVYAVLFGTGSILFARTAQAIVMFAVAIASTIAVIALARRRQVAVELP